ncbi:MAG TPA: hypothetical protein VK974_05605 [Methylophilaceae bacterium]|nr:hypothetical protein [Methylophilaceae bacterium]
MLLLSSMSNVQASPDDGSSPEIQDGIVKISIIEPDRAVGYTVGDILERTVTLEVKKPYKLLDTSLPIVGYEHRYKGQVSGIELSHIRHETLENDDNTIYTLYLAYQVFTNNVVAKPAVLPAEVVKFKGPAKASATSIAAKTGIVQYTIPSWNFRISPLAVFGSVKVEQDMSPLRGPLLLDPTPQKLHLKILLVILGLSLLGLLYILGMRAWLPLMGRPFGKAYRDIRKLPATPEALQQAVARMHLAINATAGSSIFTDNLDTLIASKPAFAPVKTDMERFLGLSRQVFFEPQAKHDAGSEPLVWLKGFCRRCRDCERGLTPDTASTAKA